MNKEHLALRKKIKTKKPDFVNQDSWKRKRIRRRWQRPKGYQSKMRKRLRSYNKMVAPGYGSPRSVYGLHPTGLESVIVCSVADLSKINKESQGALISGAVGNKKRVEIVKKAEELGVKLLNIKDPKSFLNQIEEALNKNKEDKAKREEKKKQAEKKKPVKKEEKDKLAEKLSEEDKKEAEKKEKDKLLTKQEK